MTRFLSPLVLFLAGLVLLANTSDAWAEARRVFIAGDSTAAEYGPERAPRNGWGQHLQGFLDPELFAVHNHAIGGRSSRSFIEEGRLQPIIEQLRTGDVLLIQFGHNDAKYEDPRRYNEPEQAYPHWLMRYVAAARERGATPILLTPVSRRIWDFGSLLDTQAMRELAAREQVALIDLNASSTRWLRTLGDEPSKAHFEHVPERDIRDDTHFSVAGAAMVACLVVRDWKALDPALAAHVVRDTDCGAPADARQAGIPGSIHAIEQVGQDDRGLLLAYPAARP